MISQVLTGGSPPIPVVSQKLDVDALVDQRMPPSSSSLLRLMDILRNYSAPRGELIKGIQYDPVLTARILRLANSPIYAFEREITLIDMAITAIGTQAIYDIVIIELASRTFNSGSYQAELSRRIWEHSVAVAVLTKKISKNLDFDGAEESFICGLLHDFGKYILLNYNAVEYGEILRIDDEAEMLEAELSQFGYNHAEIGSLVARRWHLPEEVCLAIANHHGPANVSDQRIVQSVIDVADTLANLKGFGMRDFATENMQFSESCTKLGLTEDALEDIWESTQGEIAEVIASFS